MMKRVRKPALTYSSLFERCFTFVYLAAIVAALLMVEGCRTISVRAPAGTKARTIEMEVTGYDNGPKSCGWERNWYGMPVYSYGPNKGKRKKVGITASGTRAKHGTIAADSRYPFGTVMYVPGYGYGRVEDRGGAIKGNKIDLWFPSEREALKWGRKKVNVTVWLPNK